jgi:hypothetical protein
MERRRNHTALDYIGAEFWMQEKRNRSLFLDSFHNLLGSLPVFKSCQILNQLVHQAFGVALKS